MDTIVTPRLTLRPWRMDDAPAMFDYARDPEIGPAAGWPPHDSVDVSRRVLKDFIEQGDDWAITETGRDVPIGSLGLAEDRRRGWKGAYSLGYVLARPYWGRGYMTEAAGCALDYAFDALNAELVSIMHYPFNARSKRVIEKLGFRYEGTLRYATLRFDGELLDDVCYSMTRAEFMERKGR